MNEEFAVVVVAVIVSMQIVVTGAVVLVLSVILWGDIESVATVLVIVHGAFEQRIKVIESKLVVIVIVVVIVG